MPSDPVLIRHFSVVLEWDWSDVERLKAAIEYVRDSGNSLYTNVMEATLEDLARRTAQRLNLPVHGRPIIAVDVKGKALTGSLKDLTVETLPYDPNSNR